MGLNVFIRKLTPKDLDQLVEISRYTFKETFAALNTEENMAKYLEEAMSSSRLSAELNDINSLFYFAETENKILGYLKLNRGHAQTELKDGNALEIERIYTLKEYHGKRIGQLLYNKAIEVAREENAAYVWLGVWEENQRAIAFYKKNGFLEFGKHIFRLGDDDQTDIMMKLNLR